MCRWPLGPLPLVPEIHWKSLVQHVRCCLGTSKEQLSVSTLSFNVVFDGACNPWHRWGYVVHAVKGSCKLAVLMLLLWCVVVIRGDVSVGRRSGWYRLTTVGFTRETTVVLEACTPLVGWSSWCDPVRSIRGTRCSWFVRQSGTDPCTNELGVFPSVALRLPLDRIVTPLSPRPHWVDLCF